MQKHMIEIIVKNNSPWKSVFEIALKNYMQQWGYAVTTYKLDDAKLFVGVETK